MDPFRRLVGIGWVCPVAHGIVGIQVNMVDAPIIRSERRDHLVLLVAPFLLLNQLVLQRDAVLELLLLGPLAFCKIRVGFLQFYPSDFLVLDLPLRPPCIPYEEQDDGGCNADDNAHEERHVVAKDVHEVVREQPLRVAVRYVLRVIAAQHVDSAVQQLQQPFVADFHAEAALVGIA